VSFIDPAKLMLLNQKLFGVLRMLFSGITDVSRNSLIWLSDMWVFPMLFFSERIQERLGE